MVLADGGSALGLEFVGLAFALRNAERSAASNVRHRGHPRIAERVVRVVMMRREAFYLTGRVTHGAFTVRRAWRRARVMSDRARKYAQFSTESAESRCGDGDKSAMFGFMSFSSKSL